MHKQKVTIQDPYPHTATTGRTESVSGLPHALTAFSKSHGFSENTTPSPQAHPRVPMSYRMPCLPPLHTFHKGNPRSIWQMPLSKLQVSVIFRKVRRSDCPERASLLFQMPPVPFANIYRVIYNLIPHTPASVSDLLPWPPVISSPAPSRLGAQGLCLPEPSWALIQSEATITGNISLYLGILFKTQQYNLPSLKYGELLTEFNPSSCKCLVPFQLVQPN